MDGICPVLNDWPSAIGSAFTVGAGVSVFLLLFFAVSPIFSVVCGLSAGKNNLLKKIWALPIIVAVSFLEGVRLFF